MTFFLIFTPFPCALLSLFFIIIVNLTFSSTYLELKTKINKKTMKYYIKNILLDFTSENTHKNDKILLNVVNCRNFLGNIFLNGRFSGQKLFKKTHKLNKIE